MTVKNSKVAIHYKSTGFAPRWIAYCDENNIPYKLVNCHDPGIHSELEDCSALFYHLSHNSVQDMLIGRAVLYSAESKGIQVFPNFNTSVFFDNKLLQKYWFDALGVEQVPTHAFVEKDQALAWAREVQFPKVFKLASGASSSNVKLVTSYHEAKSLINKAFGRGFSGFDRLGYVKEGIYKFKNKKINFVRLIKYFARAIVSKKNARYMPRHVGYCYFQDYLKNNDGDYRVIVIGKKAFAIKRYNRKNDFRASGSGSLNHSHKIIPDSAIQLAFRTSEKLKSQALAIDIIFSDNKMPRVVEVSFGFIPSMYVDCEGYWDETLNFHAGPFNPYGWMIDNTLNGLGFAN